MLLACIRSEVVLRPVAVVLGKWKKNKSSRSSRRPAWATNADEGRRKESEERMVEGKGITKCYHKDINRTVNGLRP